MRRLLSNPLPSFRRRPALPLGVAFLFGAALLTAVLLSAALPGRGAAEAPLTMPEFKHQQPSAWLNTAPISRDDLRGQVVLIEIWTSV